MVITHRKVLQTPKTWRSHGELVEENLEEKWEYGVGVFLFYDDVLYDDEKTLWKMKN